MMMRRLLALASIIVGLALAGPALAANCPSYPFTLTNGQTADANQVMSNFNSILTCANGSLAHSGTNADITTASVLNSLPSTPVTFGASVAGGASINLPQGSAPTSPNNGDIWTTSAGIFVRINGATVGPLSAATGSVTTTGSPASGNLTKFSGAASITNGDLAGDCTTSGTLTATCLKTNGTSFGTFATANAATPPAIGGTTPAAGTFTVLAGNTSVTGGTGSFTTLADSSGLTGSRNGIGATSTDADVLQNTTAAAAGAQQWSPRLHFIGQGWKTNATAASQTVDAIMEAQPVQGAANPTFNLVISGQVNAGGFGALLTIPSGGGLNLNSGTYQIAGTQITCSALSNSGVGCSEAIGQAAGTLAAGNDSRFVGPTQNSQSAAYTFVLSDGGGQILHPSSDTTARTFTIPANSSVAYQISTKIEIVNDCSAGVLTLAITTDTLEWFPAGTTGSRTIAACGIATATKIAATKWVLTGNGIS